MGESISKIKDQSTEILTVCSTKLHPLCLLEKRHQQLVLRDSLVDGEIKGDVPVAIGGTNMHWPPLGEAMVKWWRVTDC